MGLRQQWQSLESPSWGARWAKEKEPCTASASPGTHPQLLFILGQQDHSSLCLPDDRPLPPAHLPWEEPNWCGVGGDDPKGVTLSSQRNPLTWCQQAVGKLQGHE